MDEDMRDTYNKFGKVKIDPRHDELRLQISIILPYILWAILCFILTSSHNSSSSRPWLAGLLLVLCIAESIVIFFDISDVFKFWSTTWTEHETINLMHHMLPFMLSLIIAINQYYFFDIDLFTIDMLQKFDEKHKVIHNN